MLAKVSSWLTVNRVRWHAAILAICLWSAYAYNVATPGLRDRNGLIKGTDFLHFYTLGAVALHGHGDWLYSAHAQSKLAAQLVPGSAGTIYLPLYGPQVSLFFAPFAWLPYEWALAAWLATNTAIYFLCCYFVWKICVNLRGEKWAVLAAALAFPAFLHLLAWGQTAGLALACFTAALLALHGRRPWLAGLALGCLIFKPQLALASGVVFLVASEGTVVLAAIGSGLAQLLVGWAVYGTVVMRDYATTLWQVRELMPLLEPRPYQTHCLRTFWSMLLPWTQVAPALYAISAICVLMVAVGCWKAANPVALRYSILLFATVLISPHLTVYDLVILAPAFLLLSDWIAGHRDHSLAHRLKLLLYIFYPLVLIGPLARTTHVQPSVPVMMGIVWVTYRIAREQARSGEPPGRDCDVAASCLS